MLIHRMISVFKNQENQALELSPGLNILQVSKESGSASWCAFLLSMFYGSAAEDPDGPLSEIASGRLDFQSGDREFTLMRLSRPEGPPLSEFRALSEGRLAPELTGENCGESLLGAARDTYIQSALIGRKERDPELERRVDAILPAVAGPGEIRGAVQEEVEFHRQGGTGLLPTLEAELQETTALLATQEALASRLESQRPQKEVLAGQAAELEEELARLDRWEAYQQGKAYRQAEEEAAAAEEKAASYRSRLDGEGVPELNTVSRLRGAIVNLNTTRKNSEQTRVQRDQAAEALLAAETKLNESPFADMTKEEALAAPLHLRPQPRFPHWGIPFLAAAGLLVGIALYFIRKQVSLSLSVGCGAAAAIGLVLLLSQRRKQSQWEALAEERKRLRETELAEWEQLRKAAEAARAENSAKSAAWESVQSTLVATEQGILQEVRRFAPGTTDIPSADAALRAAAVLRKELSDAEAAAREARIRCSLLPVPENLPEGPVTEVFRSREDLLRELEHTRTAQASLNSELDRLTGRLEAIGDPGALRNRAEALADQIGALEKAYRALTEALSETEDGALTFGRRTVEIFAGLVSGVPEASPEEAPEEPEAAAEETEFQNTPEQLYLAARLAAFQTALPGNPPLLLDDALSGLDGDACEAALRWLKGAAKERQILLFTSRDREAACFQGDPAVHIQKLSAPE